MEKHCNICNEVIHPQRVKILPKTTTCVSCSNTGRKKGITVLNGNIERDDTWVDVVLVEPEEYNKYIEQQNNLNKITSNNSKAEINNSDENLLSGEDTKIIK
jgi:ribonuclease HIII